MPTKIELIVDNLDDPESFDAALPRLIALARAIPGLDRLESGRVWPKQDGTPTPAFRTFDLWFAGYDEALAATESAEGGAFVKEFWDTAGGKVTGLFTDVEEP